MTTSLTNDSRETAAPFGRLVVATDGSSSSEHALGWTRALATGGESRVWLMHVLEHPTPYGLLMPPFGAPASVQSESRREAERVLLAADRMLGLPRVESVFGYGPPAKEITELARSVKAELVTVGSHGRTGFDRLVLGSVANAVNERSTTNVLVARTAPPPHTILAAVDGSPASISAAHLALRLARFFDTPTVLAYVQEEEDLRDITPDLRFLAGMQARTRIVVSHGDPGPVIVEEAVTADADLIVMGSRGLGRVRGILLGSVSRDVVARSKATVLVTKGG